MSDKIFEKDEKTLEEVNARIDEIRNTIRLKPVCRAINFDEDSDDNKKYASLGAFLMYHPDLKNYMATLVDKSEFKNTTVIHIDEAAIRSFSVVIYGAMLSTLSTEHPFIKNEVHKMLCDLMNGLSGFRLYTEIENVVLSVFKKYNVISLYKQRTDSIEIYIRLTYISTNIWFCTYGNTDELGRNALEWIRKFYETNSQTDK